MSKPAKNRKDLTGQRFGQLTVIRFDGDRKTGQGAFWICHCDRCGQDKSIRGVYLTGPRQYKDCGCSAHERTADLTGRTMGALEVLELLPDRKYSQKYYRCRCLVCGHEKNVYQHRLLERPDSCGCLAREWMYTEDGSETLSNVGKQNSYNGANVWHCNRTAPNKGNTSGYRWVQRDHRNRCWKYIFYVAKQLYYCGGFETAEDAFAAASKAHTEALREHNVPTVAGFRTIKAAEEKEGKKDAEI